MTWETSPKRAASHSDDKEHVLSQRKKAKIASGEFLKAVPDGGTNKDSPGPYHWPKDPTSPTDASADIIRRTASEYKSRKAKHSANVPDGGDCSDNGYAACEEPQSKKWRMKNVENQPDSPEKRLHRLLRRSLRVNHRKIERDARKYGPGGRAPAAEHISTDEDTTDEDVEAKKSRRNMKRETALFEVEHINTPYPIRRGCTRKMVPQIRKLSLPVFGPEPEYSDGSHFSDDEPHSTDSNFIEPERELGFGKDSERSESDTGSGNRPDKGKGKDENKASKVDREDGITPDICVLVPSIHHCISNEICNKKKPTGKEGRASSPKKTAAVGRTAKGGSPDDESSSSSSPSSSSSSASSKSSSVSDDESDSDDNESALEEHPELTKPRLCGAPTRSGNPCRIWITAPDGKAPFGCHRHPDFIPPYVLAARAAAAAASAARRNARGERNALRTTRREERAIRYTEERGSAGVV